MEQDFRAWFWVSDFLETNGFGLCFVYEIGLESESLPLIVQHFNKGLLPSPPNFVFRICLCLMVSS